jgi:PHP family Zn ribbon phosphoesterase
MAELYYDFHLHSCLSPCADAEMTPRNIVNMMALAGFDIIAVSDHNSTLNCPAVLAAAAEVGIIAVPAMELTTQEEIHVLCLLPDLAAAKEFGEYVYSRLPDITNRPEIFGHQLQMAEADQPLQEVEKLLISAADIGIYDVYDLVKLYGGTAIPAHIDRQSFSLISNLGIYDPTMQFPLVELSKNCDEAVFKAKHNIDLNHITNSDAHNLEQIPDPQHKIELSCLTAQGVIESIEACRR